LSRLVPLLLAALAFSAAVVGCGGGGGGGSAGGDRLSRSQYEQALSKLGVELTKQFGSLGATTLTPTALKASFLKQADGWETLEQKLAAIEPPADIAKAHEQLVAGTRAVSARLREAAKQRVPRPLDLGRLAGFQQIQEALRTITDQGYRFDSGTITMTVQGG
jgi:hypothetical protein